MRTQQNPDSGKALAGGSSCGKPSGESPSFAVGFVRNFAPTIAANSVNMTVRAVDLDVLMTGGAALGGQLASVVVTKDSLH